MKIIHMISGGDVGGAKTHVLSLVQRLRREHTVLLVCFTEGVFAEDARALGIPVQVVQSGSLRRDCRTLVELIGREGFQVVHCHGSRANMMGALIRKRVRLPVVTTIHSDYHLDYLGRPLHNLTYGTINKVALRFLDGYICVSSSMAARMEEYGFDPKNIYTVRNGVEFDGAAPAMTREAYLDSIGLHCEPDSVIFGIAARISPVKDMDTLVRAFAEAVKQCPSIRLVIAGTGEQEEEIKALAARLCPRDSVCFAGWVSDTNSFYNAVDVNVLSSLSEGFPYSLLEGARMGCPMIATRVGGIPDLVEDGVGGILFEPKDTAALTAAICRLAEDDGLRAGMGRRLLEKARSVYSIDVTVDTQVQIYQAVLRRTENKNQ